MLQDVLKEQKASVAKVLVTHWHHDHVGGIEHFRALYPDITIYKHQPEEGQAEIKEGERFSIDGSTLRAVFSPGHTQDHMTFVLEEESAMFTGDNVLGQGTAVFEDLSTYLSSLEKMIGTFSGRAYPGHGPVIEDGSAKILEYIRHRQQREDQVIEVLKSPRTDKDLAESDGWTSMDIVKVIYKDVPEDLHIPANGGVLQVLDKLEQEEKVVKDSGGKRWRMRDRSAL